MIKDDIQNTIESIKSIDKFLDETSRSYIEDPDCEAKLESSLRKSIICLQIYADDLLAPAESKSLGEIDLFYSDTQGVSLAVDKVMVLIPTIERNLLQYDESSITVQSKACFFSDERMVQLNRANDGSNFDLNYLFKLCNEVNLCFKNGSYIATVLLLRTILNYVPPIFGQGNFISVASQAPKSIKRSFERLQGAVRDYADIYAHTAADGKCMLPDKNAIEASKIDFDILLKTVIEKSCEPKPGQSIE